jgi:hypothetical protein
MTCCLRHPGQNFLIRKPPGLSGVALAETDLSWGLVTLLNFRLAVAVLATPFLSLSNFSHPSHLLTLYLDNMKVILSTGMICVNRNNQIKPYLKGMTYDNSIKKTGMAQASSPHKR